MGRPQTGPGKNTIATQPFDQEHTITLGNERNIGRMLKPGDIVGGDYQLLSLIGQGGMGYVFRAEHTFIRKVYALKILAPEQLDSVSWKRFESEGRAIAALDHPGIVKVYNMGIDAGNCPFYVMDLLQGDSLAAHLKVDKQLDFYKKLDIFRQIAAALEYAHGKGIVHRDVKPSNVVLVPDERGYLQATLVDFGIAKLINSDGLDGQRLTATGQVFGTPYYMSPEQCLGEPVDARSDIYSLGCALYEAIAGRPPFAGANAMETVMMHLNEPVVSCAGACPDAEKGRSLNNVIGRMMAKKPGDRYQSMAQVGHDLERIREGKSVGRPKAADMAGNAEFSEGEPALEAESGGDTPVAQGARQFAAQIAVMVAVIMILAAAAFFCRFPSSRPAVSSPTLPGAKEKAVSSQGHEAALLAVVKEQEPTIFSNTAKEDTEILPYIKDPRVAEAAKAFRKIGTIDATILGAERIIHCPAYPLGEFYLSESSFRTAKSDVHLPVSAIVSLKVDWSRDPGTFGNTWIFQKIDPSLIQSFNLVAVGPGHANPSVGEDSEDSRLVSVLKTAASWRQLNELGLNGFPQGSLGSEVWNQIGQMNSLSTLRIRGGQADAKTLAKCKILGRIEDLDLEKTVDIDYVIKALNGSQRLKILKIGNTHPTPEALKMLANCPGMTKFNALECSLGPECMKVISTWPRINSVEIGQAVDIDQCLKTLSQSKTLRRVKLQNPGWEQDKLKYRQMYPMIRLD